MKRSNRGTDHSPGRKHRRGDHSPGRRNDHSSNGRRKDVSSSESTLPRASDTSVTLSDNDRRSRKRSSDNVAEDQAKRIKLELHKRLLPPVGPSPK